MRLGIADLIKRWPLYGERGLRKIRKREGFPVPIEHINCGRTPVWDEADIKKFETENPWLIDAEEKRKKRRAFAICQLKKQGRL